MKNVFKTGLALAACVGLGAFAFATVTIDEEGVGFVSKGRIQEIYGWNNHQLQANAHLLEFRFSETAETTWECDRFQDHPTQGVRLQYREEERTTASLFSNVAYDARKNRQGQITGFNLNGFGDQDVEVDGDGLEPGTCPEPHGNIFYVFVEGSVQTDVIEEGNLRVSIDGISWTEVDLPIEDTE